MVLNRALVYVCGTLPLEGVVKGLNNRINDNNSKPLSFKVQYDVVTVEETSVGGGGHHGSFLACEDFGRMFDHSFPACTFFSFFFLKWKLARAH